MKVLTSLKNAASSAISILQQPALPQQLQADGLSFRPINTEEKNEQQLQCNVQGSVEDTTRPKKRPRISAPEPALRKAGMEENLFWTLHRALGLQEVADFRDLSQAAQMKM